MDLPHDLQRPSRVRLGVAALTAVAALACSGAYAQANPFYVGASQALTYESNFFRVAEGQPESREAVSTTSLLAGLDQPIGRQRLFGDVGLHLVRLSENRQLDHTASNLLLGVDLSALDAFSGRVSFSTERTQARYGADFGFVDPSIRIFQTKNEFVARGEYGLVSLLAIEAAFVRRELDFSIESANQFEQDAVSLGFKVRPSGALTLGIAGRRTDGSNPFAVPLAGGGFQANDYKREDVDLTALWDVTGASTLTARLSQTREKHEPQSTRNVSGTTGALTWAYKATGKLNLIADYIHDTGAESSFNQGAAGGVVPMIVSSTPLATTWQLRAAYEATAKIQVLALIRQFKRELVNTAGAAGDDKLLETRLGVNWAPLRSVLVGCTIGQEKRDASSALSYAYSATSARCLAQFKTQ